MMKKFLSLVLALAMSMALAACSNTGSDNSSAPSADSSQQATVSGEDSGAQSDTPTEVTITSLNGSGKYIILGAPFDEEEQE